MARAYLVFVSAFVLDVVWTFYIRSAAQGKTWAAAILSALTIALGAFNAISFVHDPRYVLPAALGAFVGTFVAMRNRGAD